MQKIIHRGKYTDAEAVTAVEVAGLELADGKKIAVDEIRARDAAGLKLYDDGGKGIFVSDGGNVGIGTGTASVSAKLQVKHDTFPVIEGVRTTTTQHNNLRAAISVKRETTGDMANGFGGGFAFSIEDNSGVSNGIAAVYAGRDGADDQGKIFFAVNPGNGPTGVLSNKLVVDHIGNIGINGNNPTARLDVNSNIIRLRTAKTPATAGAAGNQGDICWDADYIYVCTATNTWKRTAISTW